MLRIVWISANSFPNTGGMQSYNNILLKELSKNNLVLFITDEGFSHPEPGFVTVETCQGLAGSKNKKKWFETRLKLHRIILEFKPDVIHLGDAGMAVYAEIFKSIPIVATVHGNDLTSPWQLIPDDNLISKIVEGLNLCSHIIAISKHTSNLIKMKQIITPTSIINHVCDINYFRPKPVNGLKIRKDLSISESVPILLSVGRIVARKNYLFILDALRKIQIPYHWVIIGEGKPSLNLISKIYFSRMSKRVTFLGKVSNETLLSYYNACSLFVLTPIERKMKENLDTEGFGLVFLEASACSVPVIATNVSGCKEAVIDGKTGILVEPGNVEQLSQSIYKLLTNPALAKQMGRRGRLHRVKLGGWDTVVKIMLDIYKQLIGCRC